jgi:hypothetical protein
MTPIEDEAVSKRNYRTETKQDYQNTQNFVM